jgi:hypothetical protein
LTPFRQIVHIAQLEEDSARDMASWLGHGWRRRTPQREAFEHLERPFAREGLSAKQIASAALQESLGELASSTEDARGVIGSSLKRRRTLLDEDWKRSKRNRSAAMATEALGTTVTLFRLARSRLAGAKVSWGGIDDDSDAAAGAWVVIGALGMVEAASICDAAGIYTGCNLEEHDEIARARAAAAFACEVTGCTEDYLRSLPLWAPSSLSGTLTVQRLGDAIEGRLFDWSSMRPIG